jgi:hypothetical protein
MYEYDKLIKSKIKQQLIIIYSFISFESKNNINGEGNVEFELDELAPGN